MSTVINEHRMLIDGGGPGSGKHSTGIAKNTSLGNLKGKSNWHIVQTPNGRKKILQEHEIEEHHVRLGGPYETKQQAKDESYSL